MTDEAFLHSHVHTTITKTTFRTALPMLQAWVQEVPPGQIPCLTMAALSRMEGPAYYVWPMFEVSFILISAIYHLD